MHPAPTSGNAVAGAHHRVVLAFGFATLALGVAQAAGLSAGAFQDGKAGFVVSHIAYALSKDAGETGACPDGMSLGPAQIYAATSEGKRHDGESDQDYTRRLNQGSLKISTAPDGKNLCANPESGAADPNYRIVTGKNVPADGIDLDGQDSHIKGKPVKNGCAHDDFRGLDGSKGVDNQFYRLVGCSKSYQSTGQSNTYEVEMYTGSWGILLTLGGVDSLQNDPDVEVGFFANADPIQLSPTREALASSTYAIEQDPRFQAKAHGRIVNGVLSTDPVDIRVHWVVNSIHLERPLSDARVRLSFTPDGGLEGLLAGYTSVEDLYDFAYGFRSGKDGAGKPANQRLILGSANGQARVLGHTCNGAYYAMKQLADGHRDPASGQCTAISTQYRIKAIPAFVVNTPTKSVNAALDGK
jgi:hypothetical protein